MEVAIPLGNYDEMCSFGNVGRVPMVVVIPLGNLQRPGTSVGYASLMVLSRKEGWRLACM